MYIVGSEKKKEKKGESPYPWETSIDKKCT